MSGEFAEPWTVAEPFLVQRSRSLLKAVARCRETIEPPENVHDLRVAARRLEAALDSFAPLLAPKRQRRSMNRVQRIRRAAGRIRDLDVLIPRLKKSAGGVAEKALIAALKDERGKLVHDLKVQLSKPERNRLRRELKRVTEDREQFTPSTNLEEWALDQMAPVLGRFLNAASRDLRRISELHRLRRRGKQLRYSLELFQDHLNHDACSRLLKSLQRIQERLGDMNDHASAYVLLREVAESADARAVRGAAHRLAKREKRLLKRNRRRFLEWWQEGAADRIYRRVQSSLAWNTTSAALS